MKEKRDCKIVQDLLPNYIEKLTNEETNKYIEEHLNGCEDCRRVLKEMKNDVGLEENRKDKKEVNFIRKFNIRFKLLRNILIIIALVFILVTGRKMFILTKISNKVSKVDQDNYYLKLTSYSSGETTRSEYYYKDMEYLGKITRCNINKGEIEKIIIYKTDEESLQLAEFKDKKTKLNTKNIVLSPISFVSKSFFTNLCLALSTSIDKVNLDGKECHIIKYGEDTQLFIQIETGLPIKMVDIKNNRTVDYYYEYGVVKDSDIVRPDTTGYEEI